MIITRIRIDNLYSFQNTELDLTYPKKIIDNPIEYEYLPSRPNFRYKRVCILMGANASGKSSLGRVLVGIQIFIVRKDIEDILLNGITNPEKNSVIEIEFTFPTEEKPAFHYLKLSFRQDNHKYPCITYVQTPIRQSDSVESCRRKIQDILQNKCKPKKHNHFIDGSNSDHIKFPDKTESALTPEEFAEFISTVEFKKIKFGNLFWNYEINEYFNQDSSPQHHINSEDKAILTQILKTFDPAIDKVTENRNEDNEITGFNIVFHNQKTVQIDTEGVILKNHTVLSTGTIEAIHLSCFINFVLTTTKSKLHSGTLFLDEKMAYTHAELERTMVNLVIAKMNPYTQFFYTTHNYDILTMQLPIHTFTLLKKDANHITHFIHPEKKYKKNDRHLLNNIQNDVFHTLPDTTELDNLLWLE
ncbi:hypothetical protein PT286_00255 [Neisseriaceae bacterium ESL0693]|nr:hypothetical protein [Neisseriaceae bacterium ESL0693]